MDASTSATDAADRIVDSMKALKKTVIDILIITHPDQDHFNQLGLLEARLKPVGHVGPYYPFNDVYIGGDIVQYTHATKPYTHNMLKAKALAGKLTVFGNLEHHTAAKPKVLTHGGASLYLVCVNYPTRGAKYKTNDNSIVTKLVYAGQSVMLSADATGGTEGWILGTYTGATASFLQAKSLKLGHHGSKTSSTVPWIKAVSPDIAFASGDQKWGHPYCEVFTRLQKNTAIRTTPAMNHGWVCGDTDAQTMNANWTNHQNSDYFFTTVLAAYTSVVPGDDPAAAPPTKKQRTNATVTCFGTRYWLEIDAAGKRRMTLWRNFAGDPKVSKWF